MIARHQTTFPDKLATAARRKQAAAAVPVSYHFDPAPAIAARARAHQFFATASAALSKGGSSANLEDAVRPLLPAGTAPVTLHSFYSLTAAQLPAVQDRTEALLGQAEAWRFSASDEGATVLTLLTSIPPSLPLAERTAVGEVLSVFLTPTQQPDLAATARQQRAAEARVPTQYSTLYPGQVIIRRGDIVTPTIMQELQAVGNIGSSTGWRDAVSSLLIGLVIVTMLFWYLHAFQAGILGNPRLLFLIDAGILLVVAAARFLTEGHVLLPFLLPVAAVSTFAAVLMAPEACIALALAIAILAGWVVANSFELMIYYFLTGAAGVLAVRQVRRLKQFMLAGGYIAVFALATALAFGLVAQTYDWNALQDYVFAAAFNGFVSSAMALGGFALLSSYFGVTTILHLFELGQPNQPLLRRLSSRAPGTYNHSLIVSHMVEQAAEAIGADSLTARVAALYHDVGKTTNPHCFVENQLGMANIHDELPAEESARIIRGHVVQGLRLARQYRLPRPILDAIGEHHGTMNLVFFLHKAEQQNDGEPIDLAAFSYPGPKPQSKETALLMLADGCESAVRAAADHSADNIQSIVRQIFRERADQGQLDECPLTLKDLERVRSAFCTVLNGLYHPRIEYPEPREQSLPALPVRTAEPAGNRE